MTKDHLIILLILLIIYLISLIYVIYVLSNKLNSKNVDESFRDNVTKLLITYTILIIASTAGITKFVFLDYQNSLQECLKAKEKYEENDMDFYKNKATMLQKELDQYIEILSHTDGTKKYYEAKILTLENNLNKKEIISSKNKTNISNKDSEKSNKYIEKYEKFILLEKNDSFHNKESNFTIGINSIHPASIDCTITINKQQTTISSIPAGKIWYTKHNNKEYEILLKSIDYVTDKCEIVINEL